MRKIGIDFIVDWKPKTKVNQFDYGQEIPFIQIDNQKDIKEEFAL